MIKVFVENIYDSSITFNKQVVEEYAKKIFFENKHSDGKITIIIMNDIELSKLNKQFLKKDNFTDIITFNLEENGEPIEGEIYISFDRIKKNSIIFNQKILDEFDRIIIHGLLHLLGYNDKTEYEKNQMTKLENKYLGNFSNIIITL